MLELLDERQRVALETRDRIVDVASQVLVEAFGQQGVQVDTAAQQAKVALLQDGEPARRRHLQTLVLGALLQAVHVRGVLLVELLEGRIQKGRTGQALVVVEGLVGQLVDQLIEAEVHLGLDLLVEEALVQIEQGTIGRIVVDVQRIEDELGHAHVVGLDDVVGEDPRQRHLDRELQTLAQLQVELTIPEVGHVTHLLHVAKRLQQIPVDGTAVVEFLEHLDAAAEILVCIHAALAQVLVSDEAIHQGAHQGELRRGGGHGTRRHHRRLLTFVRLLTVDRRICRFDATVPVGRQLTQVQQVEAHSARLLAGGADELAQSDLHKLLHLIVNAAPQQRVEHTTLAGHQQRQTLDHGQHFDQHDALLCVVVVAHRTLVFGRIGLNTGRMCILPGALAQHQTTPL
mmetsp:Transcript_17800/g.53439  ORF Transcript_17800/g.53439 Transcript_17800/m.53439 type:complete len:401 (+) Transcript_17800:1881-3083(+)